MVNTHIMCNSTIICHAAIMRQLALSPVCEALIMLMAYLQIASSFNFITIFEQIHFLSFAILEFCFISRHNYIVYYSDALFSRQINVTQQLI